MSTGMGDPSLTGMSQGNHAVSETMTERILYWLLLDTEVRALAERLLQRFAVTVGDLPAKHRASPRQNRGLDGSPASCGRGTRIDTLVSPKRHPQAKFLCGAAIVFADSMGIRR
jgi:hypothetical protein